MLLDSNALSIWAHHICSSTFHPASPTPLWIGAFVQQDAWCYSSPLEQKGNLVQQSEAYREFQSWSLGYKEWAPHAQVKSGKVARAMVLLRLQIQGQKTKYIQISHKLEQGRGCWEASLLSQHWCHMPSYSSHAPAVDVTAARLSLLLGCWWHRTR
jgi:hypothetical protein